MNQYWIGNHIVSIFIVLKSVSLVHMWHYFENEMKMSDMLILKVLSFALMTALCNELGFMSSHLEWSWKISQTALTSLHSLGSPKQFQPKSSQLVLGQEIMQAGLSDTALLILMEK